MDELLTITKPQSGSRRVLPPLQSARHSSFLRVVALCKEKVLFPDSMSFFSPLGDSSLLAACTTLDRMTPSVVEKYVFSNIVAKTVPRPSISDFPFLLLNCVGSVVDTVQ